MKSDKQIVNLEMMGHSYYDPITNITRGGNILLTVRQKHFYFFIKIYFSIINFYIFRQVYLV